MTDTQKPKEKSRFKSWRELAILTTKEKVEVYPTLNALEKGIIWCKEYMKIIPLQCKTVSEVMTSNEYITD